MPTYDVVAASSHGRQEGAAHRTPDLTLCPISMGRSRFIEGTGATSPTAKAGAVAVAQSLPRPTIHNGAHEFTSVFRGSGTLCELRTEKRPGRERPFSGRRGVVGNTPSAGSAMRFARFLAGVPWESYDKDNVYVGNLTYPGIPRDGRQVAADKKAFTRRLDRIFGPAGRGYALIWCKEFQKRGSWHMHFILYFPYGHPPGVYCIVRDAWLAVIHADENIYAYLHGVECSVVQDIQAVKLYESKYMNKKSRDAAKAYEKQQPEWFKGGGRWWGVVGVAALGRSYKRIVLHTRKECVAVKRILREYVRHITQGRYVPKSWSWSDGMTILAHGHDQVVCNDVIRWVTMSRAAGIFSF